MAQVRPNEPSRPALLQRTLKFSSYLLIYLFIQGVAIRFEQAALPGFFIIWCGLHQLDLVLQQFYAELMDKSFYGILTDLISYLQQQFNLIAEMKTKAKTVADTRWESMSRVSNWFKVHQVQLLQYLEEIC